MELTTPSGRAGGPTLVFLAAQDDLFLNEQFENGDKGSLFKLEGIRVLVGTIDPDDPESLKVYHNPIGWVNIDIESMGDNEELYRWPYLMHNNRDRDDFGPIMRLTEAFSLEGEELQEAVSEVIDVEQWMSTFAAMSLFGVSDVYSYGGSHNLNFYVRPSDGKILAFPWDWDSVFGQPADAPLHGDMNIGKVIDLPTYEHVYLGQMQHLTSTVFQRSKLEHWITHYGELLDSQFGSMLNSLEQRRNFVLSQLPEEVVFQMGENVLEMISEPLVDSSNSAQILVPTLDNGGDQLGDQWKQTAYTPSDDWETGLAGIGFENTSSDFVDLINHDVLPMRTVNASAFIRIPFEVDDATSFDRLKLRMHFDDGFVAYLNGEEIVAANQPESVQWDSNATASRRNTDVINAVTYDLSDALPLLQDGENVLAIHGLNFSATSSDFLIVPELLAETFPEIVTKEVTATGSSVELEGHGWINVRQIRIAGRPEPLDVEWISATQWKTTVPLESGVNVLQLEAIDYEGKVVGRETVRVTPTSSDFNNDGILDAQDIDLLCAAILSDTPADTRFDLNGDGEVTYEDHEVMIRDELKTSAGDANLDGLFSSDDLIEVLQYLEYEDDIDGNSTWAEGDWNCDGDFTSDDIIEALQTNRYEAQAVYREQR